MIRLFLDIETIPSAEDKKNDFLEILKSKNGNSEKSDEELFTSMSFDGAFGRICCIGYIKEDERGIIEEKSLIGNEKEMLQQFWKAANNVERFVGHNIYEFDMPFIYKRSRINGVFPRMDLSFARYRSTPFFDTMKEWDLWGDPRKTVKLDTLAKIFDLKSSKDEMDGSMVWQYYQDGRIEEISKYCMKDVILTRQVYYKMFCKELPSDETNEQSSF
ncbi:MAG: 3-5 exonuclease [Patescibacteria group bacterium]|nr:3-5 exonuclease [Patescibacteria group bacterium]